MRPHRWMIVAGLAMACLLSLPTSAAAVGVGSRAPEIGLVDARGNRISIGRYRGKVLLVNVWATWCEPCRDELPAYQRLYARYFRQGFRVVGVNVDRDESAMRRFVDRHGILFPNVHDADRAVAERWGGNTMPTTWVVGPRGVVRLVNDGYHAGDERRIERVVRELLADVDAGDDGEAGGEAADAPADDGADDEAADGADEAADEGAAGGAAGPADAPPEVEPGESGRSGGLCSVAAPGTASPAAMWPLALALLGVGWRRRRRAP